jgi:uncharacterized protein (DUF924 family)
MANSDTILTFWFGPPESDLYGKPRQEWFSKNPDFDQQIRTLFLADYHQAAQGGLDSWVHTPLSCLALILLLDQMPRNMFRDTPQAFATDPQALAIAEKAVVHGLDRQLLFVQRWFMYLPFEHSENLVDQRQSVQLFSQLEEDPDSQEAISYAIRHRQVIEQFGRFPHRNRILGRPSTPPELVFLQQPGSWF